MNELNNLLYFTLLVILLYSIVTIVLLEFAFGSHDQDYYTTTSHSFLLEVHSTCTMYLQELHGIYWHCTLVTSSQRIMTSSQCQCILYVHEGVCCNCFVAWKRKCKTKLVVWTIPFQYSSNDL